MPERATASPSQAYAEGVATGEWNAKDATLEAALAAMQAGGTHFALVVDDERTVGAAMLEDVVERLIGEVKDAATVSRG